MSSPLHFDPVAHAYSVGGRRVPGVTSVIAQVVDLSMVPRDVLERKRAIGSALHECIKLHWCDELDQDSVDPAVAPYWAGWRDWLDEARSAHSFDLHGFEQPMASARYGYAGTPDLWGEYRGRLAIIDPKTVSGSIGPHVGLQLAAYGRLLAEQYGPAFEQADRYALQLMPDGRARLVQFEERSDWPVFCALLTAYQWREKHGITHPTAF